MSWRVKKNGRNPVFQGTGREGVDRRGDRRHGQFQIMREECDGLIFIVKPHLGAEYRIDSRRLGVGVAGREWNEKDS